MADENNPNINKKDYVARTIAVIGLIVALVALGWAIRADQHAADAMTNTTTQTNQQPEPTNNATPSFNSGEMGL